MLIATHYCMSCIWTAPQLQANSMCAWKKLDETSNLLFEIYVIILFRSSVIIETMLSQPNDTAHASIAKSYKCVNCFST